MLSGKKFRLLSLVGILFAVASEAAPHRVRLQQTAAVFPSLEPEYAPLPGFAMLSRRTSAGWGFLRVRSATASTHTLPSLHETLVCGPSLAVNTLTCHALPLSRFVTDIPIPGYVSATPLFHDDSWITSTTKGFVVRMRRAITNAGSQPAQRSEHFSFWGAESRKAMAGLKADGQWNGDAYVWSYSLGTEVVGQPLVFNKTYFAVAANQFLYALDVATGQPRWTLRLAPDTTLRLEGAPLTTIPSENQILVGTSEGGLLALASQNGAVAWRHRLGTLGGERFQSIVAKPLVHEKSVIASSAEGVTERFSFEQCAPGNTLCTGENRNIEWRYPLGSIASPKRFNTGVALGGHDGTIVLLDPRSGALRWKTNAFPGGVVASLDTVLLGGAEYLVAASTQGAVAVVNPVGQVLDSSAPVGEVTGEFFAGHEPSSLCLSFVTPGFRCFNVSH